MKSKEKFILTIALVGGVVSPSTSLVAREQQQQQNLLYIFPDQYRLYALSLWSNPEFRDVLSTISDPVDTPNIDRLAKGGVVFTQAVSMFPLSSPHRGMLMSGMYPHLSGTDGNCNKATKYGLRHDIVCFTDVLSNAGYDNGYVGKTHWEKNDPLFDENKNYVGTTAAPGGFYMNPYDTYIPEGRGRHSVDFWYQQIKDDHYNAYIYSNRSELVDGNKDGDMYQEHRFSAEVEADVVIKYLKNENNERNPDKPFSMIWSINPPHPPYTRDKDCDPKLLEKYMSLNIEELIGRKNVDRSDPEKMKELQKTASIYFALVEAVDKEIGRVLDVLEQTKLDENTIVVYTSDHGEMMGSNGKMGKNVVYDESYRVPFIIRYPGVLEHRIENLRINSIDIMPTILGLMDLSKDIPKTVQGRNYAEGLLSGRYGKLGKPNSTYYMGPKSRGFRGERYTYTVSLDGTYLLFDNIKDPYQINSIKLEELSSKTVNKLKTTLGGWIEESDDKWFKSQLVSELITY